MPYVKNTWLPNEPIISDKLNHIEDGIENKLDITGGTMTGTITFSSGGIANAKGVSTQQSNGYTIWMKSNLTEDSNNGVTGENDWSNYAFRYHTNREDNRIADLACGVLTNGSTVLSLNLKNMKTDGNVVSKSLSLSVSKDGTLSYNISDPSNFRNALGANNGIWSVTQGGTGNSTGTALYATTYDAATEENINLIGVNSDATTVLKKHDYLSITAGGSTTKFNMVCNGGGAYIQHWNNNNNTKKICGFIFNNVNGQYQFYEYPQDGTNDVKEYYYLPVPSSGLTETKGYSILTSKTPVTVAQGGTGATTVAGALAALNGLTKELNRDTFNDLNNTSLVGHAVISNPGKANMPPKMISGSEEWFDVYLFGYIQIAISYSNGRALWVRTYTNTSWTEWTWIGGGILTGTATPANGITITSNYLTRIGKTCNIDIFCNGFTQGIQGTNETIVTVPENFRPSSMRLIPGFVSSVGQVHSFKINTDGTIKTATTSSTYAPEGFIFLFGSYAI